MYRPNMVEKQVLQVLKNNIVFRLEDNITSDQNGCED